ncbi:MAG: hypothetical protein EOM62_12540 [Bacteroidia bacterium]|nr:hypothetical protein [Bacteroidia bacterium]
MDFEKEDILDNPAWEYFGTYTDIKSGRTISSQPGFQGVGRARSNQVNQPVRTQLRGFSGDAQKT